MFDIPMCSFSDVVVALKVGNADVIDSELAPLAGGSYKGTRERGREGAAVLRIPTWKHGRAFPP